MPEKTQPSLDDQYKAMHQLATDLAAFFAQRRELTAQIPAFIEAAAAEEKRLDPTNSAQHCRLRQLNYLRRALAPVPALRDGLHDATVRVRKLNQERVKAPRPTDGPVNLVPAPSQE